MVGVRLGLSEHIRDTNAILSLLLDEEVAAGSVFVVPRFAVALISAGANGAEWVSLVKSARYVYVDFGISLAYM